jgi:hypothetical protein
MGQLPCSYCGKSQVIEISNGKNSFPLKIVLQKEEFKKTNSK